MTHEDFVKKTAAMSAMPFNQTRDVINAAFKVLTDELRTDGRTNLKNIGKLVRVFRSARPGRNPRTGEPVLIPDRQSVKFKPSKNLEL